MDNKRTLRSLFFYLGIPIFIIFFVLSVMGPKPKDEEIYSDIVKRFESGQVTEYSMNLGSGEMEMKLSDGKTLKYVAPSVVWIREDIKEHVKAYNVQHPEAKMRENITRAKETSWWAKMLPELLWLVAIALVFMFFMRRTMSGFGEGGKPMAFGRAKTKNMSDTKRKTLFSDVAGADEEKEELKELVEFLQNPKKYNQLGARIPKGVLLVGPPGTGKTLLARAVAGEAGVPFFSISGSDFVEMFVGVGASRVRDLFEQAKKNSPCIIFIDEIDAVGRQRGAGLGGGHDEREQTLNQLLVEMDGFGTNEGVIMIAATNRPDVLDPALMRPGRFDRQVMVGMPDIKGREEILQVHSKGKPLASDVELKVIAKTTSGFTGADLENLLNEAALLAARKNLKTVTMDQIEEAMLKVIVGTEKRSRVVIEKERASTAYHEAGHAIIMYFCETQDPVHQISIIPRGLAGGFTMSLPKEDRSYRLRSEMEEDICGLLGGMVAEALTQSGDTSTGVSNDLKRATKIAQNMVTKYGMSSLGPVAFAGESEEIFIGRDMGHVKNYSEDVAAKIDTEVKKIISVGYKAAEEIIKSNMDKLHEVANFLIANEKMNSEEFEKVMKGEAIAEETQKTEAES